MRCPRTALVAALVVLPAVLYGCVELTGQRFTWFHDKAADTLHLLIQYDGIHESKAETFKKQKGAEQIPAFLRDGDVMILDWFGHMRRKQKPPTEAAAKALSLTDAWRVRALGHYREPNGRVGAAQLVSIPKFSACLASANRLFDQYLLAEPSFQEAIAAQKPDVAWRSAAKMLAAAKRGNHAWIRARGHAFELRLIVDRDEWAHFKGKSLVQWLTGFLEEFEEKPFSRSIQQAIQSLAALPISYSETGDLVTLTLGDPKQPRTWHVHLREDYNDKLESVVKKHVPARFTALLGDETKELSPGLRTLQKWLPAEVHVAALLEDLRTGSAPQAARRLDALAKQWNSAKRFPTAPIRGDTTEAHWLAAWKNWYSRRRSL